MTPHQHLEGLVFYVKCALLRWEKQHLAVYALLFGWTLARKKQTESLLWLRVFARRLCRYLCVAGVVESWCILCDLNGTSLSSFPLPLLLKLIQLIQGAYRGRLYRFYILYAPRLFQFVAKPLVAALPATTAKKVRVYTHPDEWNRERRMQFASHQLEQKFGGTAPNITEVPAARAHVACLLFLGEGPQAFSV